tara:strand:+ start:1740 stop:1970 length:231 start_codon:yes stop_codon:yes gene_type:complete
MARKKVDTRQIACAVCGYEHYIKDGGWVILGSRKPICYSIDGRDCYGKMSLLRSDKARQAVKEKRKVDILKEFDSW